VLLLLAVGGYRSLGGSLALSTLDPPILVIGFVYVLVTSVAGEEVGWRDQIEGEILLQCEEQSPK
jgi:hypothetical protein